MRNKIIKKIILSVSVIIFFFSGESKEPIIAQRANDISPAILLDEKTLKQIGNLSPIDRDEFWRVSLNSIVESTLIVEKIEDRPMFRKEYRIAGKSLHTGNIVLSFFIYTEKPEYKDIISPGDKFNFRGQMIMVTPISSKRDSFVIDVILESGEISIK